MCRFEKAYSGYHVFPVDWRIIRAREAGEKSFRVSDSPAVLLVNLDQQDIQFYEPPFLLPFGHFSFSCSGSEILRPRSPERGKLLVIDLDCLPLPLQRAEYGLSTYPVPSAATSLVKVLAEECTEQPPPHLVRALTEVLVPSLADLAEEEDLTNFRNYISRHLGEQVSTEDIATALGMSVTRLRELVRDTIGMTPVTYLREERAQLARDLLATTTTSIEQIAERTGYSDRFAFTRAFTAATGVSPSAFRESMFNREIDHS